MVFAFLGMIGKDLALTRGKRKRPHNFNRTPEYHRKTAHWVIVYTNRAREKYHRRPLERHLMLQSSAQGHSNWMSSSKGKYSHTGHHGTTPNQRIKATGFPGDTTGENIYKHPAEKGRRRLAKKLVDGWMKSPGHKANILHPSFAYIGVGVTERGVYVYATQNFGG